MKHSKSAENYPSIRIFQNPWLEKLTHIHPLTPLIFWSPIISYLLYQSLTHFLHLYDQTYGQTDSLSVPSLVWWMVKIYFPLFISALFTWTFVEYALHRFIFHYEPTTSWGKRIIYLAHGVHHVDPHDPTRLVMPIIPGVIYASCFYFIFKLVLGEVYAGPFLAFFLMGYLVYDYIHYSIHHFVPKTSWGKSLRKFHLIHHVHDHRLYGVSSPLWDYIWGTFHDAKKKSAATKEIKNPKAATLS